MPDPPPWLVLKLGQLEYREAWELQHRLVEARQQQLIDDVLLLLEHPHTYTLGRRASEKHLLWDQETMGKRGVACHWVDRGGDITYHGPGQIVGYPILDLRRRGLDVHRYLRAIEEALMRGLAAYGVAAQRDPAYTGVWVEERKIAAIGVRISRGVTSHGFALNINTDLSLFDGIIPCGIRGRGVTSLETLLGRAQDIARAYQALAHAFVEVFGGTHREVGLETLTELVGRDALTASHAPEARHRAW